MAENDLFQDDELDHDVVIDPDKDYFSELVGEGKKYKDQVAAGAALVEKDAFIESLKRELKTLREDYFKLRDDSQAKARMEDLVNQLRELKESASNLQPEEGAENETGVQSAFKPEDIEALITTKLSEAEQRKIRETNLKIVKDKLRERYGRNYVEALRELTNNLGLSEKEAQDLGEKSPEALFRLLGVDQSRAESFEAPPRNNVTSSGFKPKVTHPTWASYEEMRKKDPEKYYDPQTQLQIHKDRKKYGEAFGMPF